MSLDKLRILFMAEGATLAHVGRPFVLALSLDPAIYEVTFARPADFGWLTAEARFKVVDLECQDGATFAKRLKQGLPLYDFSTLRSYVEDDLKLIDQEKPDVIVGDFRLSLAVSARLRATPYITLCDAYWSPERPLHAPMPVLGLTRYVPVPLAERIFRLVSPLAFRLHAIPMERLRAYFGLPSLGFDLSRCYTDADLRLFANFSELYPEIKPGPEAAFIGPLAWSPHGKFDPRTLQTETPLIYVTMGSSGDPQVLAALLPILESTGHQILIASAGKSLPPLGVLQRTKVFDFLPGDLACQQAALVVCNGGSPTTNQALSQGVPVLGIASNMDQFLNMQSILEFGAGLLVRADRASGSVLQDAIDRLLNVASFSDRARLLARVPDAAKLGTELHGRVQSLRARYVPFK